ncbi:MAG TPA: aminotransferase class IV, partial [Phototrophicaceae bacterium]|nr:aminotransferase class IV [Phototrophicaceae bacterium]
MSPCLIRRLTPDDLKPVDYNADSLAAAAQYEPADGVYTAANTFNTFQVLKLDAHLDRLEDSAQREQIPLVLDRQRLRAALRTMIAESGFGSVRYRITVPRPANELILTIEPFQPPSMQMYEQGVRCVTLPESAQRVNPASKTTDWVHERERFVLPPGIYTGLLLNAAGDILEGMSSNFYAVLDGELRTAGTGILPGISQQIVFTVAPEVLPVRQEAVNRRDLSRLSEAFVTSSSRGIMPVVEIDNIRIGAGVPGPQTRALRQVHGAWVEKH